MKIRENNKKFKICDIKIVQEEDVSIEANYNKNLVFQDEETKEELIRLTEEYARKISSLLLD